MPWREMSMMSERLEFIRLAMKEGANRRELCRRFNIHPDTGYKWIWRFREGADLTDRSRRPHTSPGRTSSFVLPPASANWVAGKKPPETLRSRAEGIQQDDEKVLLVSNIKVDGEPIGAFGEGEFWFHIDARLYSEAIPLPFLFALELPSTGGNTLFSNMYLAHDSLPQELKEKLLGKRALHIHEYNRAKQADTSGALVPGRIATTRCAHHPSGYWAKNTLRRSPYDHRNRGHK